VIASYRESILTAFPAPNLTSSISPLYPSILSRVYSLLPRDTAAEVTQSVWDPTSDPSAPFRQPLRTTAHALHLSPQGYILPHVDNVEASGSVIIGVSLGAERIMKLERGDGDAVEGWEVLLKSGSVYVQQWVPFPVAL
jgi:alkylated DNA repair protein alkB family protein 7